MKIMLEINTTFLLLITFLLGIIIVLLLLLFICKKCKINKNDDAECNYDGECKKIRVSQSLSVLIDGEKAFEIEGKLEKDCCLKIVQQNDNQSKEPHNDEENGNQQGN